jgi:hypothetical protein
MGAVMACVVMLLSPQIKLFNDCKMAQIVGVGDAV